MNADKLKDFLAGAVVLPGASGYEHPVAKYFKDAFSPLCDEVQVTNTGSVIARQRGAGPKAMLCAHIDEIFMVTLSVEKDGSIRFLPVGMADQTLPAQEVVVDAPEGPLFGVIGCPPPHAKPKDEAFKAGGLFIDVGLPPEEVKLRVPPGTPVRFKGKLTALQNDLVASKTLDDRACASVLYALAEEMSRRAHDTDIYYVLSSQEEYGSLGAMTAAYALEPDFAIVLDVTHAKMENCAPGDTFPIDASTLGVGPNFSRRLTKRIADEAGRLLMKVETEVIPGHSGTDAWSVQTAREGIPCALLSLPVRYMHTSVEVGSLKLMLEQAHLLAQTLSGIERGWEETLCF